MRLFSFPRLCGGLAVLCCALVPLTAAAAPIPTEEASEQPPTPAEKLRQALDQTHDFDIPDQNLSQVVAALRDQSKLNIVLDQMSLLSMGMAPEQLNVSGVNLKGVRTRTVLRNMLAPYHLTYVILGETVVITSEDMALYRQMRQPVSIDLDKVPLSKALRQLSRETATNLLLDNKVKAGETPVTLQLDDVPLETAVRLLCEMVDLKPVRIGNVLYVTSKANANELRNDPDLIGPATGPTPMPSRADVINAPPNVLVGGGPVPNPVPAPPAPAPAPDPKVETPKDPTEKTPKSEPPVKDDKP